MNHNINPALTDRATPIDNLHPHPHNARRRDTHARTALQDSLTTNGQYRTVIARRLTDDTLQLLAGHGTVEAARTLGWTHIAADIHDHIDDTTAARIVAADNRTSDLAGYDDQALADLLATLDNLTGTGYQQADLDELLANLDAASDNVTCHTDPDDAPAPRETEPTSQPGDIWLLGPHRLAVGSGTDPDTVAAALGGRLADLLLTDPPYNVNYVGRTADALQIANDHMDDAVFEGFLGDLFAAAIEHTKPGGPAYVFHADSEGLAFRSAFANAGWDLKQVLIWAKDRFVLGRQDHHWQHEPILYGWRPGAPHAWYGGRTLTTLLDSQPIWRELKKENLVEILTQLFDETTVIRADRPARNAVHPTMKPVHLLSDLIERSTRPGGTVLDSCAGSGSLLIACHHTNRRAALVEIDPTYADVICRRWEEHTGITPIRAGTDDQPGQAITFLDTEAA